MRSAILDGRLIAGTRLPSSRALADQLGIGRNVVVAAYEHLVSDGLIEARQGAGTVVAALPQSRADPGQVRPDRAEAPSIRAEFVSQRPFAIGCTLVDPALLQRFGAALRRRLARAGSVELGYGDPRGSLHLRQQIAAHLAASRGVRCDPARILVVSGTQHGLRLCAEALLQPGQEVWIEDPGYHAARRTLTAEALTLVPVPVDPDGLDVAAGRDRAPHAAAAYVTPSHQFPTGARMSMGRRVALLDWARAEGAWIFEDDYDSEFRYVGPPLMALAGLDDGDRVVYLGTFSKTLFPAIRIAYAVLPAAIVERVVAIRAGHDRFPPSFTENALADLIADGTFAAHLRRMRGLYRAAQTAVVETIRAHAGDALEIRPPGQGLHLLARLPPGLPADAAATVRARAGIEAWLLSETRMVPGEPDGFVLGFAGHALADLQAAAASLGRVARKVVAEHTAAREGR